MGDGQAIMLDQRFFHESIKGGFFIGNLLRCLYSLFCRTFSFCFIFHQSTYLPPLFIMYYHFAKLSLFLYIVLSFGSSFSSCFSFLSMSINKCLSSFFSSFSSFLHCFPFLLSSFYFPLFHYFLLSPFFHFSFPVVLFFSPYLLLHSMSPLPSLNLNPFFKENFVLFSNLYPLFYFYFFTVVFKVL